MHGFIEDLRSAAHLLSRSPGLAVGVIAALALGLGANSAVLRVGGPATLRPPRVVSPRCPEPAPRIKTTRWTRQPTVVQEPCPPGDRKTSEPPVEPCPRA